MAVRYPAAQRQWLQLQQACGLLGFVDSSDTLLVATAMDTQKKEILS